LRPTAAQILPFSAKFGAAAFLFDSQLIGIFFDDRRMLIPALGATSRAVRLDEYIQLFELDSALRALESDK